VDVDLISLAERIHEILRAIPRVEDERLRVRNRCCAFLANAALGLLEDKRDRIKRHSVCLKEDQKELVTTGEVTVTIG
jgi:hypothetical protein